VHDHGCSPNVENYSGGDPLPPLTLKNVENRAKDYLAVIANMPFYLFIYSQTKKLQNRVTLHWTACRASS
jgi:hypothetical protein